MLYLSDLKYMKLYKKQFYAPINMDDKKHGSAILLLTPNYESSKALMNNKFVINRNKSFECYYVERDIMYTVQNESRILQHEYDNIDLITEQGGTFVESTDVTCFDDLREMDINEFYCRLGNKIIFFNEMYDDEIYTEATNGLNSKYKRLLYNDRIRNNRTVFNMYSKVKEDNKWVKKTFIDYKRYKRFNIYIDLYYYNKAYLENNNFVITRSIDMYFEFIRRFILDKRITNAGYTKRTVFIPIDGWPCKDGTVIYDFKKNLNPLSVFYKKIKYTPEELKCFTGIDFVFFGKNGYFKYNCDNQTLQDRTKFMRFINALQTNEPIIDDESNNSKDGITTDIVDKLEKNSGIQIHSLTGDKAKNTTDKDEILKAELVKKINNAAENSVDEEETINKLEEDEQIKQIIIDLQDNNESGPKISATRAARITKAQDDLMKKKIGQKTVKQLINDSNIPKELPEKSLPIKTVNDEWHHLKAQNFEKEYDLNADIVKILNDLSVNKTYPVSILNIDIEDTSTSEDSIYTYTVKCEDYSGKRFTLKFDIPKFRDNRFMRLRGNEKIFSIEMPLLPISKTNDDEVQIASLYNKIFIWRYYTSFGKSNPYTDKLIKALSKCTNKNVEVITGDNSRICTKYGLPIDYIDLASKYSMIKFKSKELGETVTIYFNQDEIRALKGVDVTKGLPIAATASGKFFYYNNADTVSEYIASIIDNDEFKQLYISQKPSAKSTYSRAKVLNTFIPVIVILAHDIGLTKAMDLANIKYNISDKKDKSENVDSIKLSDTYINYTMTYDSMMLMNGLKDCDMSQYSVKDINLKMTWVEVLENFGGRIKSDGLDNFKDLMYDPITVEISKDYGLPTTYHEALIYASNLLVDNSYVVHKDLSTNRYRTNEVVAAQFYRAISDSYKDYALQNKHGRNVAMSIKQSAVIDLILAQNTTSDLSVFQPLSEVETKNTISTKGVTGMNEERAYKIDKRGYDDSMVNIIAQSTGFASTVGVNRQTTINPQIVGGRGYFKQTGNGEMNITNTYGITEALSPFMLTSDDPFRNDMTFVQTSKHSTPVEYSMPLLVTTGADAAMPYLSSDMFAHKAKKKGKVTTITNDYMLVTYDDGTKEFVNLSKQTMKNSDGGFYITLKLKTDLKEGQSVKPDTILAYDEKSFSNRVGSTDPQLSYNLGCLAKLAIMTAEDGYEDSGVCSEWLSDAMAANIVVMKDVALPVSTNVLFIAKKGQAITEGEPVLIFQNAYDEEDANLLLKSLNNEDGDVSEIGRRVVKSKVTGIISDIKIYRTCEIDELSESLKTIVSSYEKKIKSIEKVAKQASNDVHLDSTEKLPQVGKLKNVDGVLIEIYMEYHDRLGVGDKLACLNANKVVLRDVYSNEDAPYGDFRPDEKIDAISSASSIDGRMVTSIIKLGALDKVMIELWRSVQEIYGIKPKTLHEIGDEIIGKDKK